jgi:hypothetical protein
MARSLPTPRHPSLIISILAQPRRATQFDFAGADRSRGA